MNDPGQEKLYRSLFEHMLEGLAYCQMIYENGRPVDFVYLEVNEMFEKLSGLKQVVGRKISDVIPGIRKTNPELFEIYGRVASSGKPEKFESFSESFGGWLSVSVYSPEKGFFTAVFENITVRKRSEEKIRETELRYRALFEGAPYGIVILDPDTAGFIDFNDQACKQLGYPREEFAKLRVPDIEVIEKQEDTMAHVRKIMQMGRDDFETKHRNKQGDVRDVMVIAQATKAGDRLVFHCIWRDITEQKKAERKLEESTEEMKKLLTLMTGRELKMVELKEEIRILEERLKKPGIQT